MSISSEITRISGNVSDALTAISQKGVTVPANSTSDDLATLIGQIQTGSGAVVVTEEPDTGGGVIKNITAVDISSDTVDAAHLLYGYTAHDNTGTAITGQYVAPTPSLQAKTNIDPSTSSQTIQPDSGYDGLSSVQINAMPSMTLPTAASATSSGTSKATITPGSSAQYLNIPTGYNAAAAYYTIAAASGGSSWTKIAETSYQVSTTDTSAATIATWDTGDSSIWTSNKWVYVRIRDTAGKRNGYFYGNDAFFCISAPYTGSSSASSTTCIFFRMSYNSSGTLALSVATTPAYGVYADTIDSSGSIRIRSRYHSTSSRTINGTYKVEVYLLDPPSGTSIFPS